MIVEEETIFALSSGPPPSAIAVMRISGPQAGRVLAELAGRLPPPRRARLATLHHDGEMLDRALLLWLPGPNSATGEDMAELHLHGGRAVVAGVEQALAATPGMRQAEAGEFTRRALLNGRIDLNAAEALADLLTAETASQRRAAFAMEGLSRFFEGWRNRLLAIAAEIEGAIDFAEESEAADVALPLAAIRHLRQDLVAALASPPAERLRDGVRVVLAGPVNAGKSTLFNRLVGREAAIATPIAGTTRDAIEAPIAIEGRPFLFIDTAGLRASNDPVEEIGMERARTATAQADILLWMGDDAPPASLAHIIPLRPRADEPGLGNPSPDRMRVSAVTGEGLVTLREALLSTADVLLPRGDGPALNARHRHHVAKVADLLACVEREEDILLAAESIRQASAEMDRLLGRSGVEDLLDTMFSRFCVGK